jgi:hypothetical protein
MKTFSFYGCLKLVVFQDIESTAPIQEGNEKEKRERETENEEGEKRGESKHSDECMIFS